MTVNLHGKSAMVFDMVTRTDKHVFLTGVAGTGKSTLVRYIVENTSKRVLLVAPTGIAAVNIGGSTIHSMFGIPLGMYCDSPSKDRSDTLTFSSIDMRSKISKMSKLKKQAIRKSNLVIVDEVSMLRADLLDAMDYVLRSVRNSRKPFGGVQMMFVGDMLQLPPVLKDNDADAFAETYDNVFFFSARVYSQIKITKVCLDEIYRQTDPRFIGILNNLRHGNLTVADVSALNAKVKHNIGMDDGIFITTHNYKADLINQRMTMKIDEPSFLHFAEVDGYFNEDSVLAPGELVLKRGMRVMTLVNMQDEYYNGKIGTITSVPESGRVTVRFDDGQSSHIDHHTWENVVTEYDAEFDKFRRTVIGKFTQYPLKPAYAITVHKSQGLTFDRAILDIREVFAAGQAYTALSRLRSIDGLTMITHIDDSVQIRMDEALADFVNNNYLNMEVN